MDFGRRDMDIKDQLKDIPIDQVVERHLSDFPDISPAQAPSLTGQQRFRAKNDLM
jgi:hypothetical protein